MALAGYSRTIMRGSINQQLHLVKVLILRHLQQTSLLIYIILLGMSIIRIENRSNLLLNLQW